MGSVPGDSLDLSGLDGVICDRSDVTNCIPRATFGGWGSGISYTGHDNVFMAVPDRGPFNGLTTPGVPYLNRVHFLHMIVDVGAPLPNIRTTLLDTRLLLNETGRLLETRMPSPTTIRRTCGWTPRRFASAPTRRFMFPMSTGLTSCSSITKDT